MNRQRNKTSVIDPRKMFILAEEFSRANGLLVKMQRQASFNPVDGVPRPTIMIHAVSLELLFKCLHVLDHVRIPTRTHDLKRLFDGLASETRSAMRDKFDPRIGQMALDEHRRKFPNVIGMPTVFTFNFALTASSRAFEHVRFAYERASRPTEQWCGAPLVWAARSVILERHPSWVTAPTIGTSSPWQMLPEIADTST